MNLLGRLWKAITDDYPDVPDSADLGDHDQDCEDRPGITCRWIEVTYRCRSPMDDGNNMPSGCDAHCPARKSMERRAADRARENNERLFW